MSECCPECGSHNTEISEEENYPDGIDTITSYISCYCIECGCEFDITHETIIRTEVIKHGNEYEE